MHFLKNIVLIIGGGILGIALTMILFKKPQGHPMIDHTSFSVQNFEQSAKFYDETLKILGYQRWQQFGEIILYGTADKPSFSISTKGNLQEQLGNARGVHVAFTAPNRAAVDAWYAKALEFGGADNGKPGLRTMYHPNYYGAFIIDPNGWRIEAVCHTPEG